MNNYFQKVTLTAILSLVALCISCEPRKQKDVAIEKSTVLKPISTDSTQQNRQGTSDTIYSSETVKILGDTTSAKHKIDYAYVKFEPFIGFSDFKVDAVYEGKHVPLDYKSNPIAKEFKTIITETYNKEGVNFGGHYTFVKWGCGSACQSSAIVDVRTGKVYEGPGAAQGYSFEKDSRMLLVNPPEDNGFFADCAYCHPEIYIWNEQTKAFEQRLPILD
ncbi:hypothetical protein ACFSC6_17890 [Rufibacter sediminis]|uniref:Lipoprotein n=1 Tax=Rufibacter sediminis TaxID=2762756 RepID=A0ABR6VQG0_9BACT|nr:hypothetical protein [Rufibacter sediminis]MBC3539395.1 hypothetical protein [Rufibacter sediminis]